jgi:hypothetical protein
MGALLLVSCASGPERRISRNPEIFQKLSSQDQQAVREGKIREGMSKQAVFLALGNPDAVADGRRSGKPIERWTYNTLKPVYVNSFGGGFGRGFGGGCGYGIGSVGCGRYGYGSIGGFGGGTFVDYVPYPGPSVEFINSQVSAFSFPR